MRHIVNFFSLAIFSSILSSGIALANSITCPADVFSRDYERFLKQSEDVLGFKISPMVYGKEIDLDRLSVEFSKIKRKENGLYLYFTNSDMNKLYEYDCGDCGMIGYSKALMACSFSLGSRCFEFAASVDGNTQCMLIPKPEF